MRVDTAPRSGTGASSAPDSAATAPEPRDPGDWVLVLGATSAIARAVAGELAKRGHRLLLAGRDEEELRPLSADLRIRYGRDAQTVEFDAADLESHASFVQHVVRRTEGRLAGVVVAVGSLGDAGRAAVEAPHAVDLLMANFVGAVSAVTGFAELLATRRGSFIIGISSVAGDRGRQSNFVYGSAKGGFSLWLQGLRNRLWPSGVRVLTVKPGFVDTEMTWGLPGLFLVADPGKVGAAVVRALDGRRDVIYVPGFWRYIMWVIRAIPEGVFKRLRL